MTIRAVRCCNCGVPSSETFDTEIIDDQQRVASHLCGHCTPHICPDTGFEMNEPVRDNGEDEQEGTPCCGAGVIFIIPTTAYAGGFVHNGVCYVSSDPEMSNPDLYDAEAKCELCDNALYGYEIHWS